MNAISQTIPDLRRLIAAAADTISAHADELTALDQAIGDGDHGLNMKRGFEAVRADAEAIAAKPLPEALKAIGTKLVMTVGGASGPLFGTLFMALGKELPTAPNRKSVVAALGKAIDAVAARGKSQAGQKTMLDVLCSRCMRPLPQAPRMPISPTSPTVQPQPRRRSGRSAVAPRFWETARSAMSTRARDRWRSWCAPLRTGLEKDA